MTETSRTSTDRLTTQLAQLRTIANRGDDRTTARLLAGLTEHIGTPIADHLAAALHTTHDTHQQMRLTRQHLPATFRRLARARLHELTTLDDHALLDEIHELWHRAAAEILTRTIRDLCTRPAPERPDHLTPEQHQRATERERNRTIDRMLTGLARHALTEARGTVSGYRPETIAEAAQPSSRFGTSDVDVLDPARPAPDLCRTPTLRTRRLLDSVSRIPELGLFDYVTHRAQSSALDSDPMALAETIALVQSDLTRKILTDLPEPDRPNSALSLTAIADTNGTFLGWARRMVRPVTASKARDARERRRTVITASLQRNDSDDSPLRSELEAIAAVNHHAAQQWRAEDTDSEAAIEGTASIDDATACSDRIVKRTTETERLLLGAESFHSAFHVPYPDAPGSLALREQLAGMLRDDQQLAFEALKAHHDRLVGAATRNQLGIPADLVRMWRAYPRSQADLLLGRDPRVAHTMALSVLVPMPTLTPKLRQALLDTLLDASNHPDWPAAADDLANAYARVTVANPTPAAFARFRDAAKAARLVPGMAEQLPGTPVAFETWLRHLHAGAMSRDREHHLAREAQRKMVAARPAPGHAAHD